MKNKEKNIQRSRTSLCFQSKQLKLHSTQNVKPKQPSELPTYNWSAEVNDQLWMVIDRMTKRLTIQISKNMTLTWKPSLIAGAVEENDVSSRTPVLVTWHLADAPLPLPRGWPTPVARLRTPAPSVGRRGWLRVSGAAEDGATGRRQGWTTQNDPSEPNS